MSRTIYRIARLVLLATLVTTIAVAATLKMSAAP